MTPVRRLRAVELVMANHSPPGVDGYPLPTISVTGFAPVAVIRTGRLPACMSFAGSIPSSVRTVAIKSGPLTGCSTTSAALSSVLPMIAPPGTPPPIVSGNAHGGTTIHGNSFAS